MDRPHRKGAAARIPAITLLVSLIVLTVVVPGLGQGRRQMPAEFRDAIVRIEEMTVLELAKEPVGSVTVGIVSGPELIWTQSYGYADMEKKILATEDSIYRIGSITKQFTALVLLQMVEDGKVHFMDPVEKYLPELEEVKERKGWAPPITLVQLATMTSGMGREPADLPTYLVGPVSGWVDVMLRALPQVKYEYEPDTHYHYSNIGYAMLGASLARAAGRPFVEYVKERIFDPLGMEHTAFEPNPEIQDQITKGYDIRQNGEVDAETPAREHEGRGYKVPNGAMYTTVGDLAKFVAFEIGEGPETVLKKETWMDNLTRVNSADGDLSSGYGVGFRVSRNGEFVSYGHGGSVSGYRASALFDPVSKTGAIVLRNVGGRFDVSGLCQRTLEEIAKAKTNR